MSDPTERLRAFARENEQHRGPKCSVCSLAPELLSAAAVIRAEGRPMSVIAAWLRAEGYGIADATLARHFRNHDGR